MQKNKQRKYPTELKIIVVETMIKERLNYFETAERFELNSQGKNGYKRVQKWERIYLEEGVDGLMKERRGRTTKLENPQKGRKPKLEKSVEEDLIAENQRLKMENEYLKKLHALALSRIESEKETKPE